MLPEHRILGGLAVVAVVVIAVFVLQLFDFGVYILAGLAVLFLIWVVGGMLYAVARDVYSRIRRR